MSHRKFQSLLEEFADQSLLDASARKDLAVHVRSCAECREQLALIDWTRGIIRAAQPEEKPLPAPGFSHAVIHEIKNQNLLWRPLRLIAMQAIPIMALLAVILGVLAYQQASGLLNRQILESAQIETYAEMPSSWGQEQAVISDTVFQDQDRVVDILMEGRSGGTPERNGKK